MEDFKSKVDSSEPLSALAQIGLHICIIWIGFKESTLKTVEAFFLLRINYKDVEHIDQVPNISEFMDWFYDNLWFHKFFR